MSRKPVMSALARTRAQRKALRQLMAHVSAVARQRMAEAIASGLFDEPGAEQGRILEGKVIGGVSPLVRGRAWPRPSAPPHVAEGRVS